MLDNQDSNKVRVLHVIRHMNVGGAETFIMNMYRNIDRNKIQFDFLVFGEGYFDSEIKLLGGNIFYMKYLTEIGEKNFKKNLIDFFYSHNEYKIVHSHLDQVSGIILEAAKNANVKCRIAHSHNTKNANNFLGKIYKKYLQSKINKNANFLFACGDEAAKWLFNNRYNEAIIINNGIDIEKFKFSINNRKEIRKELNINEDTMLLGHVGRFSKQKNHKFIIDIYREFVKLNSNSKLILIGEGELKYEIQQYVKNSKLQDKVMFLGLRDDVFKLYSAIDCLIFPSLYEGLSVALIEAQISGLKIVGSDTIDKKTDISGNIRWMSLKTNSCEWAKEINVTKIENRVTLKNDRIEEYNIKNVAKNMEIMYLNMYKDKI